MEEVPYEFVDSVVQLLGKLTLERLQGDVDDPLWKTVVDLHFQNRRYFRVFFHVTAGGAVECAFEAHATSRVVTLEEVCRFDPRFTRIMHLSNCAPYVKQVTPDKMLSFKEEEAEVVFGKLARCFEYRGNERLYTDNSLPSRALLNCFHQRAYFDRIRLINVGPIAADFLADHIRNCPSLCEISLGMREAWPRSILPHIQQFCLRTGKMRRVVLYEKNFVDFDFIKSFFDFWEANADFQCDFEYNSDDPEHDAFMEQNDSPYDLFRRHKRRKSLVLCKKKLR